MSSRPRPDDRTVDMTLQALECRRFGHAWFEKPQGKKRRADLRRQGLSQALIECGRCTLRMVETIDLDTWEILSRVPEGGYPPGYLAPRGTGRLPRAQARKAYALRRGLS